MNLNVRSLIIGAGILLIWGLIGGSTGLVAKVTPMIWVAAGLVPSYYLGKIQGVAGYIGTFIIIWSMAPEAIGL